ncbi:MAG: hypothetical protein QXQ53_04465 [Candidatus Methanosuratincola sp.]
MIEYTVERYCDPGERWPFTAVVRFKAPLTDENVKLFSSMKITVSQLEDDKSVSGHWLIIDDEAKEVWLIIKVIGQEKWLDTYVGYLVSVVTQLAKEGG